MLERGSVIVCENGNCLARITRFSNEEWFLTGSKNQLNPEFGALLLRS